MCAAMDPAVSLSTHNLLLMVSFIDHIDHARRAHPRWWTTARPRTAMSRRWEDAGVESQTERCMRVNWFWCGVVRQSMEKNRRCGGVEGWPGQRWE